MRILLVFTFLLFFLCSCSRKSIEPKDCYGKWVSLDDNSSSRCIYLCRDGIADFFNPKWNEPDPDGTPGCYSEQNTGIWSMEDDYCNMDSFLFFPSAKRVNFCRIKDNIRFQVGWFRWRNEKLILTFLLGDPDCYDIIDYVVSEF